MTAVLASQHVVGVVPAGGPVSAYDEHTIFAVDIGDPAGCSIGLALDVSATITPVVLLPGFALPRRGQLAIAHAPADITAALAAARDWTPSAAIPPGLANLRQMRAAAAARQAARTLLAFADRQTDLFI